MKNIHTLALAALLAAAGAAHAGDAPSQKSFPAAEQLKPMSVQHWAVIADDMVASVAVGLADKAQAGVHFSAGDAATPFSAQLVRFMADSAVKRGIPVYAKPRAGVLTVDVSTSTVSHRSAADTLPRNFFTVLTAGVLVFREVALESWQAATVAGGIAADLARDASKPAPRSEMAVSVSVQQDDRYLTRSTNVYYVEGVDLPLFAGSAERTLKVEGSK